MFVNSRCRARIRRATLALAALPVWLAWAATGQAATAPSGLLCQLLEHPDQTVITDPAPKFGWIYQPSFPGDTQHGYRIVVSSTQLLAARDIGDVWDSGMVTDSASIDVSFGGPPLRPATDYYWSVQTLDGKRETSPPSAPQHFRTDTTLGDADSGGGIIYHASSNAWANRYPVRFVPVAPVLVKNTAPGVWFVDFGQDAFGYATVRQSGAFAGRTVQARFGERAEGLAVDTHPGGSVRYGATKFTMTNGEAICVVRPPDFPGRTIDVRPFAGVVMPFRYLELTNWPGPLLAADVRQQRLQYEFNDQAATFHSSSAALNEVWELCRYSMKATSFAGAYVDGDRERKPYEADAYINQLSHYAVDREFTLARYTQEYLLAHPTWPTEWKFHSIFMAWADYLQTGNRDLLTRHYDQLVAKLFLDRDRGDGLIESFPNAPQSSGNSDIVDWPAGERDGFVMTSNRCNSVINAFYYRSLRIMADTAALLGRTNDAAAFNRRLGRVYESYNRVFWNAAGQNYTDGDGIAHASAHANFYPLTFGLVPEGNRSAVLDFLHTRGMAPSVYGAQYLVEGLFESGDADYALALMTTNGPRGWLNMQEMGSTITTEAWDFDYKPNMDWNHAWGAAPGNLIGRYVLGVRPLEAGFGHVLIHPQLGHTLKWVEGTVPTIRGPVFLRAENLPAGYGLTVNLPGNMTATVTLPATGIPRPTATVDGRAAHGSLSNGMMTLSEDLGSGRHIVSLHPGGPTAANPQ
jgi:alpha-L-rhamnosidase